MRLVCALYFEEVVKTKRKVVAGSSQKYSMKLYRQRW
jgi:hypothetical protein